MSRTPSGGASRGPDDHHFHDDDVDAAGRDERLRHPEAIAVVERRAREPLHIEFQDARPEVESDEQVVQQQALAGQNRNASTIQLSM